MDSMRDIAREAMAQMPPGCQLQRSDGEIIARHRDLLLGLERELVTGFYDTLFAHGVTAAVFAEGERPTREDTLGAWWRRTVRGPLDDDYFAWMALVGLVHVIREVSNPMMLAMTEYVRTMVADQARTALADPHERGLLVDAFGRLASTVGAVITYAYDHAVASALFEVAGMPAPLLRRLRNAEVAAALKAARGQD
ncbi:MAG: protoglobin domain-containing protein [Dermatophilaceae bacterium]